MQLACDTPSTVVFDLGGVLAEVGMIGLRFVEAERLSADLSRLGLPSTADLARRTS